MRPPRGFLGNAAPDAERKEIRRKVELPIKRMQALAPASRVCDAAHPHRPELRLKTSAGNAVMRPLHPIAAGDGVLGLLSFALKIKMVLEELPQRFDAFFPQDDLNFAVGLGQALPASHPSTESEELSQARGKGLLKIDRLCFDIHRALHGDMCA